MKSWCRDGDGDGTATGAATVTGPASATAVPRRGPVMNGADRPGCVTLLVAVVADDDERNWRAGGRAGQ
jgi:hypothetical protein